MRTSYLIVVRCQRCGLFYRPDADVAGSTIGDYHAEYDAEAYAAYYRPFRRRVYSHNWTRICAWQPAGIALDVGASFGWFLEAAPPGWQASGLEPSADAVAEAEKNGLTVVQGGIEALDADPRRYNLITLWNVLEHLAEPLPALRAIHRHLEPGGLLALSVPNRDGVLSRLSYLAFSLSHGRVADPLHTLFLVHNPSPHLVHYTPRDLRRIVRLAGFRVLAMEGQPIADVRRLAMRAKLGDAGLLRSPVGRLTVAGIHLAASALHQPNEIAVYARREG